MGFPPVVPRTIVRGYRVANTFAGLAMRGGATCVARTGTRLRRSNFGGGRSLAKFLGLCARRCAAARNPVGAPLMNERSSKSGRRGLARLLALGLLLAGAQPIAPPILAQAPAPHAPAAPQPA